MPVILSVKTTFLPGLAVVLCGAIGCQLRTPDILARVGTTQIHRADLEKFREQQSRKAGHDKGAILDELIARSVLAEKARAGGLDRDPEVAAMIRAAERELLANLWLERQLASKLEDGALKKYYDAHADEFTVKLVHVAHIVVREPNQPPSPTLVGEASPRAAEETERKVQLLHARLKGGQVFEELARENSEDRISAARGGDLGWLRDGAVNAAFFSTAEGLEAGQISEPLKINDGWHILKALESSRIEVVPFDQAKARVRAMIRVSEAKALEDLARSSVRVEKFK